MAEYTVESFDYATNSVTTNWSGWSADEAVAQFVAALDAAAEDEEAHRYLPFHRERTILEALAEFVAGMSRCVKLVANQRITLTRNSK